VNGPFFAAVLVVGVLFFLGWWVFLLMREPSRLVSYCTFLAWFLPLYYLGAWASGNEFGAATIILLLLVFIWGVQTARLSLDNWQVDQIRPEGAEEEVVNLQDNQK
jgi:hypothetical protein